MGGNTGSATLKSVLQHPKSGKWTIKAGSRDPEKTKESLKGKGFTDEQLNRVQFVKFDSAEDASLASALAGVTTAVLIMPSGVTNATDRDAPLRKQVDAAIAAGANVVAITALVAACPESEFAKAMGTWISYAESNKAHIVDLRPNFFLENFWGQQGAIKTTDSIYLNLTGSSAHIAVEDIGAFAAGVALKAKNHVGHVYNLSGPKSETLADIAAAASRALGREIKGVPVPAEAAIQAMVGLGLPQNVASGSADLFEWSNKGFFATFEADWIKSGLFAKVVGREQISTEQWFKNVAPAFAK